MSKVRLKQLDQDEISGFAKQVLSGDLNSISGSLTGLIYTGNTLSGDFSTLNIKVDVLSGQNTGISGRLDTIEQDFGILSDQFENFSGEIYGLSGNFNSLSGDVSYLSGNLTLAESDIDTLQVNLLIQSGRIDINSGNIISASGVLNSNINIVSGILDTVSGNEVITSGKVTSISGSLNALSDNFTGFTGRYITNRVDLYNITGSGLNGAAMSANTWLDRHMNIKSFDSGNLCTLSGINFLLSGGVYEIDAYSLCYTNTTSTHRAVLYNNSSGSQSGILITGSLVYSAAQITTPSFVKGVFTLPSTGAILSIRHIQSSSGGVAGGASALNDGIGSGIFAHAIFKRISI